MDIDEARRMALALPGASEAPHFELWSFRVGEKIFATYAADGLELRVFVDEAQAREEVAAHADTIAELWWGKKLSGVRVRLATVDEDHLRALLVAAWRRKVPRRVASVYDAARTPLAAEAAEGSPADGAPRAR